MIGEGPSRKERAARNLENRVEARSVFDSFFSIIQTKFSDPDQLKRLDGIYGADPDYAAEKAMVTKINNHGMIVGLGGFLGSFMFLRRGPNLMSRYLMRRSQSRGGGGAGGGYRFDSAAPARSSNPFERAAQQQGPHQSVSIPPASSGSEPPRPGFIFRAFKLGLDLFISLNVGVYMSSVWTDKNQALEDAADIPLVEGRSLVCDELCGDFIRQYGAIPQATWAKHREAPDAVMGLRFLEKFVVNCVKRDMHERSLKEERGVFNDAEHIPIPSGGVPRDYEVVLADIGKNGDGVLGSESEDRNPPSSSSEEEAFFDTDDHGNGNIQDNQVMEGWSAVDGFETDESRDEASSSETGRRWGW